MATAWRIKYKGIRVLGWPKSSFGFSMTSCAKNLKELFGQSSKMKRSKEKIDDELGEGHEGKQGIRSVTHSLLK